MNRPMSKMRPLYRLVSITFLANTAATATRFIALLYALSLGASPLTAGLLGAVFAILPALTSVRSGNMIDRIGQRQPMLAANALLAIALAIAALGDGLVALFALAVLCGLASNIWFIAHQQLVGAYAAPGERAAGYIVSALGFSLTALIAPIAAGASVDTLGYPGTLLAFAALPLASAALVLRGAIPWPARTSAAPAAAAPRRALELLADPVLRRAYVIGAMFECSWTLFSFLVPLRGTALGLSATEMGIIIGSMSVSSFGCRIFLPAIVRRVSLWRLLIVALGVLAAGFCGMALAASTGPMIAFGLLIGVGQSMGAPLVNALLYDNAPPGRSAQAIALRSSFNYSLQTALPLASGALGAALGVASGFWLLAAVSLWVAWYSRGAWHQPAR
jgi:MFS family permease